MFHAGLVNCLTNARAYTEIYYSLLQFARYRMMVCVSSRSYNYKFTQFGSN